MKRGRATARRGAARLALGYAVAATLWIMLSDRLLASLGLPHMLEQFIGSVKGEAFVVVTASLLYVVALGQLRQVSTSQERYRGLFDHAAESLLIYRVVSDDRGAVVDLVVDDANPELLERIGAPRGQVVGCRKTSDQAMPPNLRPYFDIVWDAVPKGVVQRLELHDEESDTYVALTAYPIDEVTWAVSGLDVTDARRAQVAIRQQEENIRQAYVDVLDAVTGGKLVLVGETELDASLGAPLSDLMPIDSMAQLAEARTNIRSVVGSRYPEADVHSMLSAVGEALNNVLKHALRGTYRVYIRDGDLQVAVTDEGPGIDFRNLPKATLVPGYSTTATLGLGFTIMLQLCDRVLLSTRPGRTTVVLEIAMIPQVAGQPAVSVGAGARAVQVR